ncbi:MAG: HAMP domain-containing histidine kinase [Lachnospiraceae bacterium]|nr:HAMP domain-containing histidine kinase [Lachnospiraceae bacterium]
MKITKDSKIKRAKKNGAHTPLLATIYLLGLVFGVLLLQAVPCHRHRDALLIFAERAAQEYSQDFTLEADPIYGLNYLVYDLDGNCIDQIIISFNNSAPDLNIEKYLASLEKNGAGLYYVWLRYTGLNATKSFPILVATAAIQTDGKLSGILLVVRDLPDIPANLISFILPWTFAFLLLFLYFRFCARKAQEIEDLQRTYIATMSHDLKTPITSIKALSETLLDGYVTDSQKQLYYYNTILKEANHLEDTVLEILELSKLQTAKTLYQKENAQAADVFSPILDRYAELCEDMEIQFNTPNLREEPLPHLYTAPALISRVLDLLLHNAIKFTESGSGKIEVNFTVEKNRLLVSVIDNGCGIASDQLPHIFERFYQGEHSELPCRLVPEAMTYIFHLPLFRKVFFFLYHS